MDVGGGGLRVDADGRDKERRGARAAEDLDRGGGGEAGLGDADDRGFAGESFVELGAEARFLVGVEMDVAVDDDRLERFGDLRECGEQTGELALVESARFVRKRIVDRDGEFARRGGGGPCVEKYASDLGGGGLVLDIEAGNHVSSADGRSENIIAGNLR